MLVRPGGSFFQSSVPPKPPARSGWLPVTQLHSSRLCTDISTITSPERLASKNQSADEESWGRSAEAVRAALIMITSPTTPSWILVDGLAQPGHASHLLADLKHAPAGVHGVDQSLDRFGVDARRLLAVDVLSRLQRRDSHFHVQIAGCCNEYRVHILARQKLVVVLEGGRPVGGSQGSGFVQAIRFKVAERVDLHTRLGKHSAQIGGAAAPHADHAGADRGAPGLRTGAAGRYGGSHRSHQKITSI